MKIDRFLIQFSKKPWLLAPTLSKTGGAIATTAPILMEALYCVELFWLENGGKFKIIWFKAFKIMFLIYRVIHNNLGRQDHFPLFSNICKTDHISRVILNNLITRCKTYERERPEKRAKSKIQQPKRRAKTPKTWSRQVSWFDFRNPWTMEAPSLISDITRTTSSRLHPLQIPACNYQSPDFTTLYCAHVYCILTLAIKQTSSCIFCYYSPVPLVMLTEERFEASLDTVSGAPTSISIA